MAREESARSFLWLDDMRRDLGYALRTLRRAPGFAAVAVLTLGLGIGAVTVIYSVLRNVVLDPFPYRDSSRMVDVVIRGASGNLHRGALPVAEFLDYQEQSDVFEDVAGAEGESMHFVGESGAERVSVVRVTPNTFAFLGVPAFAGRHFGPADAEPGAAAVAVLNHRTWTTRFGGDPSMVGRSITLNGEPRTIVGIMPPRFEWHVGDFWIPSAISRGMPNADRTSRWFQARLRRGVTIEQAEAQVNLIARRRAVEFPRDHPEHTRVQVITVIDWVVGRFRQTLYTLFAAVGLLLAIACCNMANMLLARGTTRERELTVRAALGASRARIVRQLLMESVVLATGGTVLGVGLAYAGIRALAAILPRAGVAWEVQLRIDQPALLFALAAAAVATLAFGVFPAFQSARRDLVAGINTAGRGGTAAPRQTRARNGLVVAEVALSVILLLGAGLLLRTFVKLVGVDLGFDPRNVIVTDLVFPSGDVVPAPERARFYREAIERANTVPGVRAAAVSNNVPPFGGLRSALEVSGVPGDGRSTARVQLCSEAYADAIGLRLVAGRQLSAADVTSARRVAVVNQTLARRYFAEKSPIGLAVRLPDLASGSQPIADPTFEIVGIVQDVANQGVRDAPLPHVYLPFTLRPSPFMGLVARTSDAPPGTYDALRRELRAADRRVAVSQPTPLERGLQQSYYAQPRFSLVVLGVFAGTGLVLIALGTYGVLAYTVSQQTRQIAIRIALGGERRHVLWMVLGRGLRLVAAGLAVGIAAGLLTNRLLENVLWQTSPRDPATIAMTIAMVVTIGAVACLVPAWRAMRVDPIVALRQE
jgi:predicted permease